MIRNEKVIKNIDFYDYLLTGKQLNDSRLQRDDVIFIPKRNKTVRALGEINMNKFVELKKDEGLKKLIEIAGGIKVTTYLRRAQIDRIIPHNQLTDINVNRTKVDVDLNYVLNSDDEFQLYDGDQVTFFRIGDQKQNTVTINGAVHRPGEYDLGDGLKLTELIEKADNLLGDPYLERVDITRTNSDYTKSLVDVNLALALKNDPSHNIELKSNDIIRIYRLSEFQYKTNVGIYGHVQNPGTKPFLENMQVYDLVFAGGGFENKNHLDNTYLERADLTLTDVNGNVTKIIPFNLDSVLLGQGIAKMNIAMGTEIRIYSKSEIDRILPNSIRIVGHVKRPGRYKIPKNTKISDVLFRAGGFLDSSHVSKTFLLRADILRTIHSSNETIILPINLKSVLDTLNNYDPNVIGGDLIRIYSTDLFQREKNISIDGMVNSPGTYELKKGMTLQDLILEAGGIAKDIYKYRVEIATIDPNNTDDEIYADITTFDLDNNLSIYEPFNSSSKTNKNNPAYYLLKPYDIVTIRPNPFFSLQRKVRIDGFVYYPGEYVISGPNDRVTDIIDRAGGLKSEANPMASRLIRNGQQIQLSFSRIIRSPWSKNNFKVMDGDQIFVGSKTNLVTIIGEVNNPGTYQFTSGKTVSDYIDFSGGLTKDASRFASFVTYPDGKSEKISLFRLSPKIYDGSIITIGRKDEVEPFSITEYVSNLTQIYADLSQAYLLIILARNN